MKHTPLPPKNGLNNTVQWQGVQCLQRSHSISPSALSSPSSCELRSPAGSSIAAASTGLPPLCNETQRHPFTETRQSSPAVSTELPLASESCAQSLTSLSPTGCLTWAKLLSPITAHGEETPSAGTEPNQGSPRAQGCSAQTWWLLCNGKEAGVVQNGCCGYNNVYQGNYVNI